MTALLIHGHFYQPPRENPWTGEVEVEPGAAPYHDWTVSVTVRMLSHTSVAEQR